MKSTVVARLAASLAASFVLTLAAGSSAQAWGDTSGCESAYRKDSPDDQVRLYSICLEGVIGEDRAAAFNNRGVAYMALGDLDQAFSDLSNSIENEDAWGVAYLNRAQVSVLKGDPLAAEADLDRVVRMRPAEARGAAYVLRGRIRARRGDREGALEDFATAVERRYRSAAICNEVAWIYATYPDAAYRNAEEAVRLAEFAVDLEDHPAYRDTLAAAYAEAERFEDAVREQGAAIETAQNLGWDDLEELSRRVPLYESRMAYRDPAAGEPWLQPRLWVLPSWLRP
jgi:tetratricopeptide (TPR) repeat protein